VNYEQLDERVQRWIYRQGWTELRDIQEAAIPLVLDGSTDIVIAAATAGGKTEAAFMPIASRLLDADDGLGVLAVSPLKALINDQFERLEEFCDEVGLKVARWHGDVAAGKKHGVLAKPPHILLITPESLEALFVRRPWQLDELFESLRYMLVDELHAFIGAERGRQLQSLLARVEQVAGRRVPRLGLSATLGDMALAADFLRPGEGAAVQLVQGASGGQELQLQVRGYRVAAPVADGTETESDEREGPGGPFASVVEHLFDTLRSGHNLVFANSRSTVEQVADALRRTAEARALPNSFWPHHGSLARELREDVEARLKDQSAPANAVCTVTLELGIDIGSVESIAQVGPPSSVAALRQRLGRSGRRGGPAVLRVYVSEPELTSQTRLVDKLRPQLVQSIAVIDLLLQRWYEPPPAGALHLSTLVQQTMSLIAQHGGVRPTAAWRALCQEGPFRDTDEAMFADLLRAMGAAEIITQSSDGTLLLDGKGERIAEHYEFYAAFTVPEEFRLVTGGRPLGSMPIDYPVTVGSLLIFAGRRWHVQSVDSDRRVIDVVPAAGGRPPHFGGGGPLVHDRVREAMLARYTGTDVPVFLDPAAATLLAEARAEFASLDLAERKVLPDGDDLLLFPWAGDRVMNTLVVALTAAGLDASRDGLAISIDGGDQVNVGDALTALVNGQLGTAEQLAAPMLNKRENKYDWMLSDDMLTADYARRALDLPGAQAAAKRILDQPPVSPSGGPAARERPEPDVEKADTRHVATSGLSSPPAQAHRGFAVIDLETTGLHPDYHHRVIEMAIVTLGPNGQRETDWATLINPERDVGATHVHGLTASDLAGAPRFVDIAGEVIAQLAGRVLVAHNLRFDLAFLASELDRAGADLGVAEGVCTLGLATRFGILGPRNLPSCCAALGIELTEHHSALADAVAAALLLRAYGKLAGGLDRVVSAAPVRDVPWPTFPPGPPLVLRGAPRPPRTTLANLVAGLPPGPELNVVDQEAALEYLALLDRVLEDRSISQDELQALSAVAAGWGLDQKDVHAMHWAYIEGVRRAAWADGRLTEEERRDMLRVAQLLSLDPAVASAVTAGLDAYVPNPTPMAGRTVCFTGESVCSVDGRRLSRADQMRVASEAGATVVDTLTRKVDLLVLADPASMSGKAKRAAEYGVRRIAEPVFWRMAGVEVD
jgi:ATP-dependent Lhr-like helicase